MYSIQQGFNHYYWGINQYEEAEWFMYLLNHAQRICNEVRKEKRERKS